MKPIAFTDDNKEAQRRHGTQRDIECARFATVGADQAYWAKAGWESGWDSAIAAMSARIKELESQLSVYQTQHPTTKGN